MAPPPNDTRVAQSGRQREPPNETARCPIQTPNNELAWLAIAIARPPWLVAEHANARTRGRAGKRGASHACLRGTT
eukprot:1527975-Lingulodinium_polyedra.AAC.1